MGLEEVDTVRCGEIEAVQSAALYTDVCEKGTLVPYGTRPGRHQQYIGVWMFLEPLDDPIAFYGRCCSVDAEVLDVGIFEQWP